MGVPSITVKSPRFAQKETVISRPIEEEQSDILAQAERLSTSPWISVPFLPPPNEDLTDDNDNFGCDSDTASLQSYLWDSEFEGGRQYTANIKNYPLPNDKSELERERKQHELCLRITEGKLFFAPVGENLQKILDIGTGEGTWAIEVGDEYPTAEVIGIDVSPHQQRWVPANVHFFCDNCEKPSLDSNVDLVHLRCMVSILRDVPTVLKGAFGSLRPGGWIELQDVVAYPHCDDGTMQVNDGFETVCRLARDAYANLGFNTTSAEGLTSLLRAAGFQNVHEKIIKVPIGTWAASELLQALGRAQQEVMLEFIKTLPARPFRSLGLLETEAELQLWYARKALSDRKVHRYVNYYFCYAQRP